MTGPVSSGDKSMTDSKTGNGGKPGKTTRTRDGIAGTLAEHATGHEFPRDDRPTALRLRKRIIARLEREVAGERTMVSLGPR